MMSVGGLRGAVTLALSLPLEREGWWTVQSIAYGVVRHRTPVTGYREMAAYNYM